MSVRHLTGDCRVILPTLPAESVHCCVTSPPYFGLRDYGTASWDGGDPACDHIKARKDAVLGSSSTLGYPSDGGARRIGNENTYHEAYTAQFRDECDKCGARRIDSQIGLEQTPDAYVAELVGVFREVRRVLRKDGTCWVNLGDSYAAAGGYFANAPSNINGSKQATNRGSKNTDRKPPPGLKPKDLIGIPWLVAFALRADGWYLRSDIIWAKPNPMPESVTDRPTRSHEYLFLLTKSARYYFDQEAVRETACEASLARIAQPNFANQQGGPKDYRNGVNPNRSMRQTLENFAENPGRNIRSVWTVATAPFSEAHFATFPPDLIEPCIKAGVPERCCARCGAPWKRVMEPTGRKVCSPDLYGRPRTIELSGNGETSQQRSGQPAGMFTVEKVHTGWSPSCACEAGTLPGTVLDPFGGAGTTGLVADRLQRNAILIELSNAYAGMASARIEDDRGPLLALMEARP